MATDPSRRKSEDDAVCRASEHHFVSYSRAGDSVFVKKLKDELENGQPRFRVWVDQSEMQPGPWPRQLEDAIDSCRSFLLVVSEETNKSTVCAQELARACNNGKVVIPLLRDPKAPKPLLAQNNEHVDFSCDFSVGLGKLRQFLKKLVLPGSVEQPSVRTESGEVSSFPPPVTTGPVVINRAPLIAPARFLGRDGQCHLIEKFLSDDASALLWIWGRAGSGKTALACRVLDHIRRGIWASPELTVPIHAIAYLNREHHSELQWCNVFEEIRSSVPTVPRLDSQKRHLASAVADVLSGLTDRRVVLLIDHLDELIDPNTRCLTDSNLHDALRATLSATTHKLKVIVTSRILPLELPTAPGAESVNLKGGLPQPEAMQLLRTLDRDGTVGLQAAADTLLAELCRRTQDNPGAIKTLYAILDEDRSISSLDILGDETRFLPERVLKILIGESYACLDDRSKVVMQILSVCKTPVTAAAVKYVFQHYLPEIDVQLVLDQLVNLQLVEKADDGYRLREADRWYVVSQLSDDASTTIGGSQDVHLDRKTLYKRHADYIEQLVSANSPTVGGGLHLLQLEQLHYYRFNEKNYAAAFDILKRLEPQLLAEGRSGEQAGYYEQLVGRLQDPTRSRQLFDALARVYYGRGELDRAAACYEGGLKCVRDSGDLSGQWLYLGNLALCKQESGDLVRTTLYCMAALELASQTVDSVQEAQVREAHVWEAHIWNAISEVLASLGQISAAMQASKRALKLARDNRRREIEGMGIVEVVALANLGQHHEAQGHVDQADDQCSRAYEFAEKIQFQLGQATARRNLGVLELNRGKYKQASRHLTEAMQLAKNAQSVQLQQTIRIELAAAQLLDSKLNDAEVTINAAVVFSTSFFTPEALSLRGIILQRQGKAGEAAESFHHALKQAEVVLKRTPRYYRGLDVMGLSYSGLTLSEETDEYLDKAIEAYDAARFIADEPGIVRRRLLLFDALEKDDSGNRLVLVRKAIVPEH